MSPSLSISSQFPEILSFAAVEIFVYSFPSKPSTSNQSFLLHFHVIHLHIIHLVVCFQVCCSFAKSEVTLSQNLKEQKARID